jgi:thioredoxin reductase (NADPH)
LLLADANRVTLSYRNEVFNRLKPANSKALDEAILENKLDVRLNTNLTSIEDDSVTLSVGQDGNNTIKLENDLVYIFAGGELPTQFLEKAGIKVTRKFGETVLTR